MYFFKKQNNVTVDLEKADFKRNLLFKFFGRIKINVHNAVSKEYFIRKLSYIFK